MLHIICTLHVAPREELNIHNKVSRPVVEEVPISFTAVKSTNATMYKYSIASKSLHSRSYLNKSTEVLSITFT